jgi:hypothetical protein
MLASGRQPQARRADLSRPAEPAKALKNIQPRRALGTDRRPRAGRAVVGVLAGAALVGGLAMAAPTQASASPIGYNLPTLSRGDSGRLVVRLQRELSAYGPNVAATGHFGKLTKKRVKELQRHNGWRATGVAGHRVWHKLLTDGHRVTTPSLYAHRSSGSSARTVSRSSVWDKLARCESGGNWHINTGNGFYGGLQFSLSTWHAYGGSGMPNRASRTEQIRIATKVQRSQGWGAWPACSARIGLR